MSKFTTRRSLTLLAATLLGGVFANIAVAWFFAITWDINDTTPQYSETKLGPDDYWNIIRQDKLGMTYVLSVRYDYSGPESTLEQNLPAEEVLPHWLDWKMEPGHDNYEDGEPSQRMVANGWPFVSLWCEYYDRLGLTNLIYGGIALEDNTSGFLVRALPVFPIFPEFIINSSFYAFIIWITWATPRYVKLSMRKRRGACTQCGYDLRGEYSSGCTECGWGREDI